MIEVEKNVSVLAFTPKKRKLIINIIFAPNNTRQPIIRIVPARFKAKLSIFQNNFSVIKK